MKAQSKTPQDFESKLVRLFVDAPLSDAGQIALSSMQINYLANVMRLGPGHEVLVFNGQEGEWLAVLRVAGRGYTLEIERQIRPQSDGPDIHYVFAPLKRAKLDYMVQKATELGAAVLQPVMTRRTVAERVNLERMRANVIEAAEQCGILRVPEILAPAPLERVLATWNRERRIIYCDEAAELTSPLEALSALSPGPLAVLIGPEGGFDPAERRRLRALDFVTAISLGPRIMRADTAAIAALALVNAVLGDWRSQT